MFDFSEQRLTLTTGNSPVSTFQHWATNGDLDLNAPYQRGDVWGLKRRQQLIRSLFLNIPIPSILVNHRMEAGFHEPGYSQQRNWAYAVVDGKQRVSTMLMFMRGEFGVPAEWFSPQAERDVVYWNDISKASQRRFENRPIPVIDAHFTSLDEERALFDLINFGGLAQGEEDTDLVCTVETRF